MTKPSLFIQGMHGLGDCIHQRAVLRQLMTMQSVTLETSWPSVYHDLVGEDLKLVRRPVSLRTQNKNQIREADKFSPSHNASGAAIRVAYGGAQVMQTESKTVLEAMCQSVGVSYAEADYRLPIPDQWFQQLFKTLGVDANTMFARERPWLVYRPLVARPEWRGSIMRNADPGGYAELFSVIRDQFFVVSVADLEPGREWIVGPELKADLALHAGELTFETMSALFCAADLVYTSSGFAAILAPAVKTPVVSVVGGYECLSAHASGARFAPYLGIGPRVECGCWTSQCRQSCDKTIDLTAAGMRLMEFVSQNCLQLRDKNWLAPHRSVVEMFDPPTDNTSPPPATPFGAQRQRDVLLSQMGLRA